MAWVDEGQWGEEGGRRGYRTHPRARPALNPQPRAPLPHPQLYCPAALSDGFQLSESGTYFVPADGPLESYLKWVPVQRGD